MLLVKIFHSVNPMRVQTGIETFRAKCTNANSAVKVCYLKLVLNE